MIKRLIPFALANSIYEIDPNFLKSLGVKTVLTDLDNTLEPYDCPNPTERCIELSKKFKDNGLNLIIASNNTSKRVHRYAEGMGIECACMLRKPFSGPLKKLIASKGLNNDEVILIGDQVMTDVGAGNGAGIKTILTEPFNYNEPIYTRFNRLFDKPRRKKIKKLKLAPDWREIHV